MKVALKDRTQSQVERKIEFYRQIPIYPKWGSVPNHSTFDVNAPICESDEGQISFVSAQAKKKWMAILYATAQREKQKGEITTTSKQNRPEVPNFRSQSVLEE